MNGTRTIGVPRRALSFGAAASLALAGTITLAASQAAGADGTEYVSSGKVWVCKYVSTPGERERPLPGNDGLIHVDWHAADFNKDGRTYLGESFRDAQYLSVVVQLGGTRPASTICEVAPPTTTTSHTSGTTTHTNTTTSGTSTTTSGTSTTTSGTSTTTSGTTTTTSGTSTTTSAPAATTSVPTTTGGAGGGVTPGAGAPETGGAGDSVPLGGLIGSGLLAAAGAVLANEARRRRRA